MNLRYIYVVYGRHVGSQQCQRAPPEQAHGKTEDRARPDQVDWQCQIWTSGLCTAEVGGADGG